MPQFVKFCVVGVSGTVVDMAVLYLLADPKTLALNITLSKITAAEMALLNNFVWNELWTFRRAAAPAFRQQGALRRLLLFNCICGAGIAIAVFLLHLFHACFGCNLYVSNALAIGLVTAWNFGMNARLNWGGQHLS